MISMKNNLVVSRQENFADWYTSLVKEGKLIEYGPVKGTMFFLPNGWTIWQQIQKEIDKQFFKIGVKNVQLPLFIKYADFVKEKQHVQGFAPELFMVSTNNKSQVIDQLIIRPTSEISFCQLFKTQIKSFNDLPLLYNQWCSVCRVEKNTRPFLRNTEFHWQELHTIHATNQQALQQSLKSIKIYKQFIEKTLSIPVIFGEKTASERFAGANKTYTLEALMQDGQALQCATSHFLGQNFSKSYDVSFQTANNTFENVWQTSAGLSTRIIGGLIMSHSDDNGLVLPFKIAPIQIGVVVLSNDSETNNYVQEIKKIINKYRVDINMSNKTLGYKINQYQIQGVPFCFVIGKKEVCDKSVTIIQRDNNEKITITYDQLKKQLKNFIINYQHNLFINANKRLQSSIEQVYSLSQFKTAIANKKIALAYFNDSLENESKIKQLTGATARCIKKMLNKNNHYKCFLTGQNATHLIYFARAY